MSNPYQSPDHQTDQDRARPRSLWTRLLLVFSLAGLATILLMGLFTARTVTVVARGPANTPVVGQTPVSDAVEASDSPSDSANSLGPEAEAPASDPPEADE